MDSDTKKKLITWLEGGKVDQALSFLKLIKVDSPDVTKSQFDSLHLWLDMIEHEAENQGVTQDMLIRHTTQLRVTKEWLKSAIKQLIKVLWGHTSTKKIKKNEQLNIVIDHVTDWLSKEMEVPAFPNDEEKQKDNLSGVRLKQVNNLSAENYPAYEGQPTI